MTNDNRFEAVRVKMERTPTDSECYAWVPTLESVAQLAKRIAELEEHANSLEARTPMLSPSGDNEDFSRLGRQEELASQIDNELEFFENCENPTITRELMTSVVRMFAFLTRPSDCE